MKLANAAIGLVLLSLTATAQQTGLTDAQRKAADLEVPQLATVLELKPGMTVADVGAGFGAWTMRFSAWIGPKGRVYATDLGAPQLAALRGAVERERLANVTAIEGAVDTIWCCSERLSADDRRCKA